MDNYYALGHRKLIWHPACRHYVWFVSLLNNRALANRVAVTESVCHGTTLGFRGFAIGT